MSWKGLLATFAHSLPHGYGITILTRSTMLSINAGTILKVGNACRDGIYCWFFSLKNTTKSKHVSSQKILPFLKEKDILFNFATRKARGEPSAA